jgi:hypothetical protein
MPTPFRPQYIPPKPKIFRYLLDAFFILLLFEGALRKWFLPGFSDALLIVRDPVLLAIYAAAFAHGIFPKNGFITIMIPIALISFFTSLIGPFSNLFIQLYGVRVNFLYIPLIFLMPLVLKREDVERWVLWTLYITIPMAIIVTLQFASSGRAWINKQIGGVGLGLIGAEGKFRPTGTFSFVNGVSCFFSLATAFTFYYFLQNKRFSSIKLSAFAMAIIMSIPLSISRLNFVSCLIVAIVGILIMFHFNLITKSLLRVAFMGSLILLALSCLPVFNEGMAVFGKRWEVSTEEQGGVKSAIVDRYVGTLTRPFKVLWDSPFFGWGLGLGTNAGAKLNGGQFSGTEQEWVRIVSEIGAFLGLSFILLRAMLTFYLLKISWFAMKRRDILPMLIFSADGLLVLNGQWGSPTILGFSTFGAGLILTAAFNPPLAAPAASTAQRK